MVLVTDMALVALIVSVATTMAMFGSDLHSFLNEDVKNEVAYVAHSRQTRLSVSWRSISTSSLAFYGRVVFAGSESDVACERYRRNFLIQVPRAIPVFFPLAVADACFSFCGRYGTALVTSLWSLVVSRQQA